MADFEKVLRNACSDIFIHSILKGCWFHYKNALLKASQKLLTPEEKSNSDIKNWLLKIMSVPLLPETEIKKNFDVLIGKTIGQSGVKRLKKYVKKQWVDGIPPSELSVYRVQNRTNNASEVFNRQFYKFYSSRNINFYDFLRKVSDVFKKTQLELTRLTNRLQITRPKTLAERRYEKRLKGVVEI